MGSPACNIEMYVKRTILKIFGRGFLRGRVTKLPPVVNHCKIIRLNFTTPTCKSMSYAPSGVVTPTWDSFFTGTEFVALGNVTLFLAFTHPKTLSRFIFCQSRIFAKNKHKSFPSMTVIRSILPQNHMNNIQLPPHPSHKQGFTLRENKDRIEKMLRMHKYKHLLLIILRISFASTINRTV